MGLIIISIIYSNRCESALYTGIHKINVGRHDCNTPTYVWCPPSLGVNRVLVWIFWQEKILYALIRILILAGAIISSEIKDKRKAKLEGEWGDVVAIASGLRKPGGCTAIHSQRAVGRWEGRHVWQQQVASHPQSAFIHNCEEPERLWEPRDGITALLGGKCQGRTSNLPNRTNRAVFTLQLVFVQNIPDSYSREE